MNAVLETPRLQRLSRLEIGAGVETAQRVVQAKLDLVERRARCDARGE